MSHAHSLNTCLEAVRAAYRRDFGGQSRATRDLGQLDALIVDTRAVVRALERRVGPMKAGERAVFDEAKKWVAFLTGERGLIVAEKALPARTPETLFVGEPGGRANVYTSMLRVSTPLADLALLAEVIEGLEACERDTLARLPPKREPWMAINLTSMRTSLAACRAQDAEIARAWSTGSRTSRSKLLIELAADQARAYDDELRDVAAPARRAVRLHAVASTLRTLAQRIRDLGNLTGAEGDAIGTALAHAEQLESDRAALLAARAADGTEAWVVALELERAAIRELYKQRFAKQDRQKVDLDLLRRLAMRAGSIALQASEIWNADPSDNHMDLRVCTRQMHGLCDAEEKRVAEQQALRRT